MEHERKLLLNNLSDAIKECQLRFGGKRELATDVDSRVCLLCARLEHIFLHGIKRYQKTSTNLVINIHQNLTPFTNILKQKGFIKQTTIDSLNEKIEPEVSFWPFIKCFLSTFEIERYNFLRHVNTDIGKCRSWLRSCLNEHCLEKYLLTMLTNTDLIKNHYEDGCFLLDTELTKTLPSLITSLQSILFAINIDCVEFNKPVKVASTSDNGQIDAQTSSSPTATTTGNLIRRASDFLITNIDKAITTTNIQQQQGQPTEAILSKTLKKATQSKAIKKTSNKRIVFSECSDDEADNGGNINNNVAKSVSSSSSLSTSAKVGSSSSGSGLKIETHIGSNGDNLSIDDYLSDENDLSPVQTVVTRNVIRLNDALSMNSFSSEQSNNNENNLNDRNKNEAKSNNLQSTLIETSSTTTLTGAPPPTINNSTKNTTNNANSSSSVTDGLNVNELREAVLLIMQRKTELEIQNKHLNDQLEQEKCKVNGLLEKVNDLDKSIFDLNEEYKVKLQNSERENQLLKDQLKKYISAVQMIRSNNAVAAGGGSGGGGDDETMQPIPAEKESLKRDYSYEAEQYEQKLIQVAEMHGELIEFNTYLHKMLTLKNMEIERLNEELVQLRGPLTNEIQSIGSQESELLHNSNDTSTLTSSIYNQQLVGGGATPITSSYINVWIPSVFLKTDYDNKKTFNVYQIYIRIKDEEWNVYRRYTQFYNFNQKLKKQYPIVATIPFPKKKAIGNKDSKFVEQRRKDLQTYLRQAIHVICKLDRDLISKPCRETIIKAFSLFNENESTNQISPTLSMYNLSRGSMSRTYTSSSALTTTATSGTQNIEPMYNGL